MKKKIGRWEEMIHANAPFMKRIEMSNIQDYVEEAMKIKEHRQ